MKIKELIAKLQKYDGEMEVVAEDKNAYDYEIIRVFEDTFNKRIVITPFFTNLGKK